MSKPVCTVIGGTGFVGCAISAEARRRNYETRVVTLDNYDDLAGTACDLCINANGNSKKFLAREDPPLDFDLSVRAVMRALHDFPAAMNVHLSSIDVYPDTCNPQHNSETSPIDMEALSPYGTHKYMAELLTRHYAKEWLIVRMGGFVGPGLWKNSIYDMLTGKPLYVHPDSAYQYLHTADFARLLFDLIEQPLSGQIVNTAGAGTIRLSEAAEWLGSPLQTQHSDAVPEVYQVNIEYLQSMVDVPQTAETVHNFIQDVQQGKIYLS